MEPSSSNSSDNAKTSKRKRKNKRTNGQGSIYKRGKYFYWRLTKGYDSKSGKPKRIGGQAPDFETASAALSEARAKRDLKLNVVPINADITFKEFALAWLSNQTPNEDSTLVSYKAILNYVMEGLEEPGKTTTINPSQNFGNLKLREIDSTTVRVMLLELSKQIGTSGLGRGRPLASRTLGDVRKKLKSIFRTAFDDRLIERNPMNDVKNVRAVTTEHPGVALDNNELTRLFDVGSCLHNLGLCRLWPAVLTAVSTGVRRGELMGLRWQDVDFELKKLRVRQNYTVCKGKAILKPFTKTKAGQREIPLPASLLKILEMHREATEAKLRLIGKAIDSETPLFCSAEGFYVNPDRFSKALRELINWSKPAPISRWRGKNQTVEVTFEQRLRGVKSEHREVLRAMLLAGQPLPNISPHDLRHTCGTQWLTRKNGYSVALVSRYLGHSSSIVTLQIYRHLLPSEYHRDVLDFFGNSSESEKPAIESKSSQIGSVATRLPRKRRWARNQK